MTAEGPLAAMLAATSPKSERTYPPIESEYTILFTARSGSSHLTSLLTSAGLGDPREWLNPEFLTGQAGYFGATDFAGYFRRMKAEFSPNRVFGHEMTIWFYERFSAEVRLEDYFDFSAPTVLLFREDLIAQAVSLHLASSGGRYHRTTDAAPASTEPPYEPEHIFGAANTLANEEVRLRAFIEAHASPLRVISYERLISSAPEHVVGAFGNWINIQPDLSRLSSPHRKLGGEANAAQAARFRDEYPRECARFEAERHWLFEALGQLPLLT